MKLHLDRLDAPRLSLVTSHEPDGTLVAIDFETPDDRGARHRAAREARWGAESEWRQGAGRELHAELARYLAGELERFTVPKRLIGTPFQLDVWRALERIPYGATRSYGQVARDVGRPRAVRAVAAANGANPIPILVPCHRVIGADGSLTGFGGGLETKRYLLELEGVGAYGAR